MDISVEWWSENGIFADTEKKETISAEFLTTVAYVKVIPPMRRHRRNTDCHIYGHISFKVGDTEVTLFSRKRDDSDHLFLSNHNEGSRLSLSDHHESNPPRPLGEVSDSNPLRVKMNLHEKKKGSGEKDVLIAKTEYYDSGGPRKDWCYFIIVPGKNGFEFLVCYSVVFGARAKVDVTIKEEEQERGFPNGEVPFWGQIAAYQYLEDLGPNYNNGVSLTSLRNIYGSDEVALKVGESIPLNRRFVVVPMRFVTYLGICIALVIDEEDREEGAVSNLLYFPVRQFDEGTFFANKNLTHTKHFKHDSGLEFHVSVEFCPSRPPLMRLYMKLMYLVVEVKLPLLLRDLRNPRPNQEP